MYKVTNISNNERKFINRQSGKWIYLNPKESILVVSPPEENEVWKIDDIEKMEEKRRSSKKLNEVRKNDSSSS